MSPLSPVTERSKPPAPLTGPQISHVGPQGPEEVMDEVRQSLQSSIVQSWTHICNLNYLHAQFSMYVASNTLLPLHYVHLTSSRTVCILHCLFLHSSNNCAWISQNALYVVFVMIRTEAFFFNCIYFPYFLIIICHI